MLEQVSDPHTRQFMFEGQRLVYDEYGDGPRVVVLMPGLLFSRRMQDPLARALAERGNRVLSLDLLGHGDSDRPRDMWRYSMPLFGEQVMALLDHLGRRRGGGGRHVARRERRAGGRRRAPRSAMRGLIIEMPVLDNALLGCAIAFTPLLVGADLRRSRSRAWLARGWRRVPRGLHQH